MSRCVFGGMIIIPAKITSSPFEGMFYIICQQDCIAGYYTYVHRIMHHWVYRLRYTPGYFFGGPKQYWWQEHFPVNKIGRIGGGRGFQNRGNMFRIGRNTFYDQKNKIPMKIPEFKRSGIGLIAESRGIPNGFPNQASRCVQEHILPIDAYTNTSHKLAHVGNHLINRCGNESCQQMRAETHLANWWLWVCIPPSNAYGNASHQQMHCQQMHVEAYITNRCVWKCIPQTDAYRNASHNQVHAGKHLTNRCMWECITPTNKCVREHKLPTDACWNASHHEDPKELFFIPAICTRANN